MNIPVNLSRHGVTAALCVALVLACTTGLALAGAWERGSERNRSDCSHFCQRNKPRCVKCSTHIGCGRGMRSFSSFKGYGDNYFACEWREASKANRDECMEYCRQNKPRCKKCSKYPDCLVGYRRMKAFSGVGDNYYACEAIIDNPEANHNACLDWCSKRHISIGGYCYECSTLPGCQPGRKNTALKSWRGRGQNWYACGHREYHNKRNEWACWDYCYGTDNCARCERLPDCGVGYKRIKAFSGKGDNWYACEDKGGSEDNHARCKDYCFRVHKGKCTKCSRYPDCGAGHQRMSSFKGRGKNWYACKVKPRRGGELKPPE
jgi:hypothetical protein